MNVVRIARNGIVALLPFAALESEGESTETAVVLQHDLETIQQTVQMTCPVTVVVCDMEAVPGCTTFLSRFPEQQRDRRLGVQFPCLPSTDPLARSRMIEQGIRWLAEELLPPVSYRLMQLESDALPDAVEGNIELYELGVHVRQSHENLARLLRQGIWNEQGSAWLLNGCFLAATGRDALREQGFVAGIIPTLSATQNYVRWLPEAMNEDRRRHNIATLGYGALAVFIAVVAWLVWR